jgi:GT2 family glycosyltransferase
MGGQVEMEHLHRYFLARTLCGGLDVLDVACGEGYGTALLAQVARSAIGLDYDGGAIAHASAAFAAPDTRFVQGSATAMPFADARFDAVVSFETIEHFADHDAFLAEIRRVLRPGGLLIISSPDRDVYSAPGMTPNPFHVRELTRAEFSGLLQRNFSHVSFLLQRAMIGSVLAPAEDTVTCLPLVFERHQNDSIHGTTGLPQALYIVAVAADRTIALPPSLFIYSPDIDGPDARTAEAHADAEAARAETEFVRARLTADLAARDAECARLRAAADLAARRAASAERRHADIETSTAWKLTWPLRCAAMRAPRAARIVRKLAQAGWWTVSGQMPQRLRWWRAARVARAAPPPAFLPILIAKADPRDINLPAHDHPAVTVIIPTYGQVDYTLRCLAAIAAAPPHTPFEVLVAEDFSGDPAVVRLRRVANLRLLERTENRGFLLNCNEAAARSEAEFLFFLNNDTQVQPGWLDPLVALLRRHPDAAAAGSKLVYPDGRLQEAGGIIWNDGSGWNYGRLADPSAPVYNYVREADYVSGAALLVRRADFGALGGFDPAYAPAYCEDSDLAFRLRAAGRKVLYQPRSVVVHFEGITHGTDLASGLKAYQVTNQARLRERWRAELAASHYPNGTHVMRARDHAHGRRVVLVIDHYVPQPDRDAGSRTMLAFMQALLSAGRVVKFWTDNGAYSAGYTEALQDLGIEVLYGSTRGVFEAWIAENGADIDGVLLSRPDVSARYIGPLRRFSNARLAYYGHDLHGARLRRQAAATGDDALREAADITERQERDIWRRVDSVLYPSPDEAEAAAALEPGVSAHSVVPYAFAEFGSVGVPPPGQAILFVAGFGHPPNEDAALWCAAEIFPRIAAVHQDARLQIVGSNPTEKVRALAGGAISIAANVSDAALAAFYRDARVAIVPLRYGAGVKLKVVEALARGIPLVTTSSGAQGCDGLERVIDVHDEPAAFAEAVIRLLADDSAWLAAAEAQLDYARSRFSEAALRDRLLQASDL